MITWLRNWRDRRRKNDHTAIRIYLASHGPTHPTAIAAAVGLSYGRLYVRLAELERAGRVESYWSDVVYGDNRRRRLYDITHAPSTSEVVS